MLYEKLISSLIHKWNYFTKVTLLHYIKSTQVSCRTQLDVHKNNVGNIIDYNKENV